MPVGAEAVAPAIPESQHKPGDPRQRQGDPMPKPCLSPRPPDHIEQHPEGVEQKKEEVEKLQHHALAVRFRYSSTVASAKGSPSLRAESDINRALAVSRLVRQGTPTSTEARRIRAASRSIRLSLERVLISRLILPLLIRSTILPSPSCSFFTDCASIPCAKKRAVPSVAKI